MKPCEVVDCPNRGKQYKRGIWVCDEHYVAAQRGAELEVADDAPNAREPAAPDAREPDEDAPEEADDD